ncbi:MAG TPA: 2'-5' RNA ligase family protein [Caulobacteraceae bacterium]|jgi:2'-5' RNA ligase|nr:2'-5' RNA ligase family protein [Caulobacteraceae bacterium]
MVAAELVHHDVALRHKIFFTVPPPPEVAARILRLGDKLSEGDELRGRRTPPDRLHVSLNGLGAYAALPRKLIVRSCGVVSAIRFPSFVLAFNRVMSFGGKAGVRPLVLTGDEGMIGADMLYGEIHAALAGAGLIELRARPFTPHLTLSWEDGPRAERVIEPIAWRVPEFHLVDSVHGQSRHDVLGKWALE